MAKQSNQKLKLLYLLKILIENTNENIGLTITQISTELAKYNISAARKSLYDDLELLRVFGIDIKFKRDRYVRYYIAKRDISSVELKYMIDALSSFDALSPSASYALATKLVKIYGGKKYISSDLLDEPFYKTPKIVFEELGKNIELLEQAISSGKKVYCRRFEWNSLKQRTVFNDGTRLLITPIRLICDEKYILYAYDGNNVVIYDVDSLVDVELSNENCEPRDTYQKLFEDQMFNFEYENVRLEFNNSFAGEVFRKFGLGVTVLSSRDDNFEISLKVKLDGDFFAWLFNNAKHVRVIAPVRVIDIYRERLLLALDNLHI